MREVRQPRALREMASRARKAEKAREVKRMLPFVLPQLHPGDPDNCLHTEGRRVTSGNEPVRPPTPLSRLGQGSAARD